VLDIVPADLAQPNTLNNHKAADSPMTIVGYPLPSPAATENDWDGSRRVRTSGLDNVLDEDWATWSLPSNLCFGDSGGPIFLNERVVANVSDGGIDCLSASTNARLDTPLAQKWIRETIKSVLNE